MNKQKIILLITFYFFVCNNTAPAQEENKKIMSQIQNLFEQPDSGSIAGFLNEQDNQKVYLYSREKGIDIETAQKLLSLQNPFIPQLPKVETPDAPETPTAEQTPLAITLISTPTDGSEAGHPQPQFALNGLVWNTNRPQAILNNQIVDIGDNIDSWTVTEISQNGVKISFGETTYLIEPQ